MPASKYASFSLVFHESGRCLAVKKIGKNNPKAERIQTDNGYRMRCNREVDRAILIAKALQKARGLSAKLYDKE